MKNFHLIIFFFLSTLILNTSCKKDSDDDGLNIGSDNCTASWKVNNDNYEKDLALCVYLDNTLNLSASTTGGDFQLQINPITTNGTYIADPQNQDLTVLIIIKLNDGTQIGSSNATINVSELSSSKAKGTFSGDFFDLADLNQTPSFAVTDGVFSTSF